MNEKVVLQRKELGLFAIVDGQVIVSREHVSVVIGDIRHCA